MGSQAVINRKFNKVMRLADEPKIKLLTVRAWNKRFKNHKVRMRTSGRCDLRGMITVKYRPISNDIEDTIWHETLHILLPSKRHWWVECAAQKLSHNRIRGFFATRYKKSKRDVPDIKTLLRHIRNASARFNDSH